ncbi:hypothetical protein [Nonomuraea typhae]|uniref:Uncharacterized protein n=1 Tax=Nonomuraea typhae TaxID=2603600 RepID=A0ABW7YJ63_9ACTN
MMAPELPREIYYVKGGRHARPYANVAHLKSALKTRWAGYGTGLEIFVAVITDKLADWPDGWINVTNEFLDDSGRPKW